MTVLIHVFMYCIMNGQGVKVSGIKKNTIETQQKGTKNRLVHFRAFTIFLASLSGGRAV